VTNVLKLPAYRRLLVAYTINELAWSIGPLALAVLVYRRTGSAVGAMAFFLCSQFVPALISPAVVARLDQLNPRAILPVLYALEGVAFLALARVASKFALAPVLVLTVLDGILALTARSLARAVTVAVTQPVGLLKEGNALTNAAFSICYFAGPGLGGLIVVTGGISAALLANAGLFALIAVTLATAGGLPQAPAERTPSAGRLRSAWNQARSVPAIRTLLLLQAAALVFFTISIPVEVVFAQHTLHAGAGGYGALLSAWGAGAIIGSAVYARWRALPAATLVSLGAGSLGAGFVVMAAAPTLAVAIVGAVVSGAGNGIEAVSVRTALQENVQERWMALVMSLNESIAQAVPGIGIALGGAIAALAGARTALAVAGIGALAMTLVAWLVLRPATGLLDEPPAGAGGRMRGPEPQNEPTDARPSPAELQSR
jgi:predicted MFS family arabinose efflux permease